MSAGYEEEQERLRLEIEVSGTFRNVPLLLSHACLCAVRLDAYVRISSCTQKDDDKPRKEAYSAHFEYVYFLADEDAKHRYLVYDLKSNPNNQQQKQ